MTPRDQAQAVRLLRRWSELSKEIVSKCSDERFIQLSAAWELLRVQTASFVSHEAEETPAALSDRLGREPR